MGEQLALWEPKDEASIVKWAEAKDKALWKRTRRNFEEKKEEAAGPPKLTKETAREFLTKAIATFRLPANKTQLETLIKECEEGADQSQAGMMKMMKLMPVIQTLMGPTLTEYGFGASDLMNVTMQIQAFAPEDASIAADVGKVMKAVQGDIKDLLDDSALD